MIEVSCTPPKDKNLGKSKYKLATGLGMVQRIYENEEGIVVMKDELCRGQSIPTIPAPSERSINP
ncbi:MAG: hypothetical protein LBE32_01435 [Burkholderiales bacterium]|jgi:hypothetical protein|nr:hypothetical protein [Burkholderiales bacterium]